MNQKMLGIVVGCILLLFLSGCAKLVPTTREITDYQMISIVGIDSLPGNEPGINLSLSSKSAEKSGQEASMGDKPFILTNQAPTIARAYQEMEAFTEKHIFLGHAHQYLIGERLAYTDIGECIDYMMRDPEARLDAHIAIVKGYDAQELLVKASTNDAFAADRLKAVELDLQKLSHSDIISLLDIATGLDDGGTALIPAVKMIPITDHDASSLYSKSEPPGALPAEEDMERMTFNLDGFALFKNFKLIAYIDATHARAINILRDRFYNDILEVSTVDGKMAGLQLEQVDCDYSLDWEDGKPAKLIVEVCFVSALNETNSRMPVNDLAFRDTIESNQNLAIKRSVSWALTRSQELGVDYLGLAEALDRKYPFRFAEYKEKWGDIWSSLPYEIEVTSKLASTFDLQNPSGTINSDTKGWPA